MFQVKCEQYWPDERVNRTMVYGELLVTIATKQTDVDYIKTTFLVQHQDVSQHYIAICSVIVFHRKLFLVKLLIFGTYLGLIMGFQITPVQ